MLSPAAATFLSRCSVALAFSQGSGLQIKPSLAVPAPCMELRFGSNREV